MVRPFSYLKLAHRLELHGFPSEIFLWRYRIGKDVQQESSRAGRMHAEGNNIADDRLHDKALEGDTIVGELLITVIELEVIVKDKAALHIRGHGNAHCGRTSVVREDNSAITLIRKVQSIAEEERTHKGQVLELPQRDGTLQQLPLLLQRIELVDELARIRKEVVIIVLVAKGEKEKGLVRGIIEGTGTKVDLL